MSQRCVRNNSIRFHPDQANAQSSKVPGPGQVGDGSWTKVAIVLQLINANILDSFRIHSSGMQSLNSVIKFHAKIVFEIYMPSIVVDGLNCSMLAPSLAAKHCDHLMQFISEINMCAMHNTTECVPTYADDNWHYKGAWNILRTPLLAKSK